MYQFGLNLSTMTELPCLKKFREDQGLTQEQAAEKVGVASVSWSRWETGQRKIARSILPTVAEKTGIPPRELRPDLAELLGAQ